MWTRPCSAESAFIRLRQEQSRTCVRAHHAAPAAARPRQCQRAKGTLTSRMQLPLFFRRARLYRSYSASIQPLLCFLPPPSPSAVALRSRISRAFSQSVKSPCRARVRADHLVIIVSKKGTPSEACVEPRTNTWRYQQPGGLHASSARRLFLGPRHPKPALATPRATTRHEQR